VPSAGTVPPIGAQPPSLPQLTVGPVSRTVLGPDGFGALKLGMTPAQAQATHLVTRASTPPGGGCPLGRLLAAPSGTTPSLFYSPAFGLAAIWAYPGITTPAGVAIGSTLSKLKQAYPTWRGIQGDQGPGYVSIGDGSAVQYRIAVSNGRVIELALQLDSQDCYE